MSRPNKKAYEFEEFKRPDCRSPTAVGFMWSPREVAEMQRLIKQRKFPCVLYMNSEGTLCILPDTHASSIRNECIVGVYDRKVTIEMLTDDLEMRLE